MSSAIIVNGRVLWNSPELNPKPSRSITLRRSMRMRGDPLPEEERLNYAPEAIPIVTSEDEKAILKRSMGVGSIWTDPKHRVTYRIVFSVDPRDGWCLIDQLCKHYKCHFNTVLRMCRIGLIDAVLETNSPTKRYRPRDERSIQKYLTEQRARAKDPQFARKMNDLRIAKKRG